MSDHDENSAGNRMPIGSNSSGNNSTTSPTRISEAPLVSDKRGESAVVMAVARKGPPIPCFAGFSKLDAASSATNTTGSNKSSTPSTSLLLQATFDTSTTLTQEADNYMDDDDDNDNDGSVSSGAGSLLSGGSVSSEGEEEEASSSSDDDDDEAEDAAAATISLEQRMLRNQQRNAQFLQSLNQKYQDQVPAELKPGSTKKRKKKKKSTNSLSDEDDEAPDHQLRGMLRQRKLPLHQDASVAAATAPLTPTTPTAAAPTAASISLAQRLQALAQQYPYREGQIRHLTAMLHGSLGAAAAAAADRATGVVVAAAQQQQSQEAVEVVQHVPAPIFISGPRGSGKTSVVKDVMTMLKADNQQKQQDQQQSSDRRSTTHMHSAYINCVTLEPSSIERLVADAYKQLRPESSSSSTTYGGGRYGRRLRKRRQTAAAGLSPKQPHSPKPQSTTSSARVDTTAALSSEDAQEQLTATEEGRGIAGIAALPAVPLQNATSNEQQHDTMVMEEEEEDLQQQPRLQPRRAAKVAVPPTNTSLATTSSGKLTARRNKPNGTSTAKSHSAVEDDPHRTEDAVETSHSAVVAFGRSLQRYFGVGSQQRERRAAILVLDGAERLLTLSARKKTSEKANCLAELLLLPKVMRLNLTIVVISRYVLLYGTRLDNIASPYKSTATLSGSVGGLTIQFPAYKDHQVMKKVLRTEKLLPLIIGTKPWSEMGNQQFMEKVIDGFLSALVQFLADSTLDTNEFVRVGRSLWPVFIVPLHPTRIQDTLASLGAPLTETAVKDAEKEKLDRDMLVFLGRRFLGEIGKVSTDLTQVTMDSPLMGMEAVTMVIPKRAFTIADLELPFLRTCLLLAAFICQNNRAENDKKVFSVHGNGKRRRTRKGTDNNEEEVAFASTGGGIEQLRSLRPRPFLVERVFSIFVTLVRLNPDSTPQLRGKKRNEYTADSLGTSRLYEDLRNLIDLGFLHPVTFSGGVRGEQINLNGSRFWCSLTAQEAKHLAKSVDIPLDSYLV